MLFCWQQYCFHIDAKTAARLAAQEQPVRGARYASVNCLVTLL
jgi:hypothetical protein